MGVIGGLNGLGSGVATGMGLNNTGGPGWIARIGGLLGGHMASSLGSMLPGTLGPIFSQVGGNLSTVFSNALSRPFAKFQLHVYETMKTLNDNLSKGWGNADQAAANYAKSLGLSGQQMRNLRDQMIKFGNENMINEYGKSIDEAIKLQHKFSEEIGRTARLSHDQQMSMVALSSLVGDDMAVKFTAALDKFGVSANGATDMMGKIFKEANTQGLSLTKYTKNIVDHLSLAQKYNFKNGVDGLKSMAELATKINMDMNSVAQFADKISTIGDAVNVGAQLQVLGGPFAEFANPFRLLHGSLNDMEDLGKQIEKLTENMAYFDKKTGEIKMSNFDRLRLKEGAKAMGYDANKLIDQAYTQARRNEVENQMKGLTNIPEEVKELIKSSATFEDGVAGIRGANGRWKSLKNLKDVDFKELVTNSKTDSENIRDIALTLRGYVDIQQAVEKGQENAQAQVNATLAENWKNSLALQAGSFDAMTELVKLNNSKETFSAGASLASDIGQIATTAMTALMLFGGKGKGGKLGKFFKKREHGGPLGGQTGFVHGTPGVESVPENGDGSVTLQGNEYVINADAVKHYGVPFMNSLNNRKLKFKKYNQGGSIDTQKFYQDNEYVSSKLAEIGAINNTNNAESGDESSVLNDVLGYAGTGYYLYETAKLDLGNASKAGTKLFGKTGTKTASKGLSKVTTKGFNNVAKVGTKGLTKIGGKALGAIGTIAGPFIDGYFGYQDDWDESVEKGYDITARGFAEEKAKAHGITAGINSGVWTAIGAGVGALFGMPWLGAAVGGLLGGVMGDSLWQMYVDSGALREMGEDRKTTEKKFAEMQKSMKNETGRQKLNLLRGKNYESSELKEIVRALDDDGDITDGELPDWLRQKMAINKEDFVLKAGRFGNGTTYVKGKPHSSGGVMANVEEGEAIVQAKRVAQNPSTINKLVNSDEHLDKYIANKPMGEQQVVKNDSQKVSNQPREITISPISLNLSGTIDLKSNGQKFEITDAIQKEIVNAITPMISRELSKFIDMADDKRNARYKGIS